MSAGDAPDIGLSESESRIFQAVLAQLTGPLHHVVTTVVSQQMSELESRFVPIVQRSVAEAVDSALSRVVSSNGSGDSGILADSRSSLSSGSQRQLSAGSGGSIQSTGSADFDVVVSNDAVAWLCPLCNSPLKDEHSFDEHLKKTLSKTSCEDLRRPIVRKSAHQKRAYCVYDSNDPDHLVLSAPWCRLGYDHPWQYGYAFVNHLRSMLTPGAREVFKGGTGNRERVYTFVQSIRQGLVVVCGPHGDVPDAPGTGFPA